MKRICLIDLSGVFRQMWHASEAEDISSAQSKTLQAVLGFAAGFDAVGICIDSPPYKRSELSPEYKAHREKAPAVMHEQLRAVIEQLDNDGYHILGAKGYEADDIIATVCSWTTSPAGIRCPVVVYSADKDMLQLVRGAAEDRGAVEVISTATGTVYAEDAEVVGKLGVKPALVADLLALVGDKSDGIPGIHGVGPKTAAAWLAEHGSLEAVLLAADRLEPARFRDAVKSGRDVIAKSFQLAQLMDDAPINPEILMQPKEPKKPEIATEAPDADIVDMPTPQTTALAKAETRQVVDGVTWERALEPQHSGQAFGLAKYLHQSRMFGDWPNPEAILGVMMTGRSFGLDAVTSLRSFHNIKGKASPSAQLLIGLVKRSPTCEWFRLVESTPEKATWETKRRDEPEPTRITFTIEQARLAGLLGNDNWKKRPDTMLRWRAGVELARVVYPDLVTGLYTPDEFAEAA